MTNQAANTSVFDECGRDRFNWPIYPAKLWHA